MHFDTRLDNELRERRKEKQAGTPLGRKKHPQTPDHIIQTATEEIFESKGSLVPIKSLLHRGNAYTKKGAHKHTRTHTYTLTHTHAHTHTHTHTHTYTQKHKTHTHAHTCTRYRHVHEFDT